MYVKKCRVCGNKLFKPLFSLGNQAIANNLLVKQQKDIKKFPLKLIQCIDCSLIQLNYIVPKEEMYDEYFYVPSISKTHLKHFSRLASELKGELKLTRSNLVVDVGSSDGSFLKCFKKKGMKVVGVEPALNIDSPKEIETYKEYFDEFVADSIVKKYGKAKLVTATNVFAHIDDLHGFIDALDLLLDEDGVFFAQFPDVRNLLKENQFDTIYHEHLSYFTYEPLHRLFTKSPFELYKVDSSTIHGGSMSIYVRRRKPLIENFKTMVPNIKEVLSTHLKEEKKRGALIAGFGAAAKGMVLLQYCGLDNKIITYIADGTPYKQGKFTPGTNIPIVSEEHLTQMKPDIVLILAWNFKEEIIEKLKKRGITSYIVPIPEVEICILP